jgi:fructose-1,6-bisphosphatase
VADAGFTRRSTEKAYQNACIISAYTPLYDSPAIGLVAEDESHAVANAENAPFLLLFT